MKLARGVGVLLTVAALPKLLNSQAFMQALHTYRLFPPALVGPLADVVGPLELVVGLQLVVRPQAGARLWAALLFLVFAAALSFAWWQGTPLVCGCFGPLDSRLHRLPQGVLIHAALNLVVAWALLRSLRSKPEPQGRSLHLPSGSGNDVAPC